MTSSLSGTRSNQLSYTPGIGGGNRDWTGDFRLAKPALCQLSYAPVGSGCARPGAGGARSRVHAVRRTPKLCVKAVDGTAGLPNASPRRGWMSGHAGPSAHVLVVAGCGARPLEGRASASLVANRGGAASRRAAHRPGHPVARVPCSLERR